MNSLDLLSKNLWLIESKKILCKNNFGPFLAMMDVELKDQIILLKLLIKRFIPGKT